MSNLTLGDIRNQVNDYGQNFTNSTIDKGSTTRAINRGIEFVQRKLGLPSDIKVHTFYFYEDVKYYDCPDYFNELLEIYYSTNAAVQGNKNVPENVWNLMKFTEILRDSGRYQRGNKVAFTTLNGKNQLLMLGKNVYGSAVLQSFDSLSGLSFSLDIANAVIDNTIYKQGSGSLKFDIQAGAGPTIITSQNNINIQPLLNNNTAYRLNVDFPVGTTGYFTDVELRFQSSTGNYYSIKATNQSDGTAWTTNDWSLLSFSLANTTTVGSPLATNITSVQVIFNHSGTFAACQNIRVDNLYQITPDSMDCVYYTAVKGTDRNGLTDKVILDDDSDIVAFGDYAYDLINVVALQSALILWPQLRGDATFWQMYNAQTKDTFQLLSRTYPHDRATGRFGQSILRR